MNKRLPTGLVWDAARNEKNWFAYAIVPQEDRKPAKLPSNAITGWAPNDANKVAVLTFEKAAMGINALNKRLPEINERRAKKAREIEAENVRLKAEGKRTKPNRLVGDIERFVPGYLPREGSEMVGLDFDHVLCGDQVADWAKPVIEAAETYTEVSSSGAGVRLLVPRFDGVEALHGEHNDAGIIATAGKGFALTLNPLPGAPTEIVAAPNAISCLTKRMKPGTRLVAPAERRVNPELKDAVNPTEWIADVYAALPNTLSYEEWISLGLAFKRVEQLGLVEAFEIFEGFSNRFARAEITPGETAAEKWDSFDPRSISTGTIWHTARELGWDGRNPRPGVLPNRPFRPEMDLKTATKAVVRGDASALRDLIGAVFFQTNLQCWWAKIHVEAICVVGNVAFDERLFRSIERRWLEYVDRVHEECLGSPEFRAHQGMEAFKHIPDANKRQFLFWAEGALKDAE